MLGSAAAATKLAGNTPMQARSVLHSRTTVEREPWWEVDLQSVVDVSAMEFCFGAVHPHTDLFVLCSKRPVGRAGNRLQSARAACDSFVRVPVAHLVQSPVVIAVSGLCACVMRMGCKLLSWCCVAATCSNAIHSRTA